jgi:integrase
MHTITRASEVARLRWDEIDFEKELIQIPEYRMKPGVNHYIPLTKYTKAILEYMKPISGHLAYVFPPDTRSKRPHVNPQTVNTNISRAGFKGILVAHGLRHTASTFMNDSVEYGAPEKFDKDAIEACLSHMDKDSIRDVYNSAKYLKLRREILEFWGKFIVEQTGNYLSIAARAK